MKKLLPLLLVLLLFSACTSKKSTEITQITTTLPQYVPGSIKLLPGKEYSEDELLPRKQSYRSIYYSIPGIIMDPYDENGEAIAYMESIAKAHKGKESDKMCLVTFIKYFKIPKEKFIELVNQQAQAIASLKEAGINIDTEEFEIPNPDIIYTFDNEIINEYYRRQ
jgi:hypothetical protein